MSEDEQGVVFPAGPDGRRSTAALGRAVTADALRPVDAAGALAAERETNWRGGVPDPLPPPGRGRTGLARGGRCAIAEAGLGSLHRRMRVAGAGRRDRSRRAAPEPRPPRQLHTVEVRGTAEPEREFSLPFHGQRLRGDALLRQLDAWVDRRGGRALVRRGGAHRGGAPRVAAAARQHRRRPRRRGRDGPADRAAAVGRPGGRRRPAPRRRCGSACSTPRGGSAGTLLVPFDDPSADPRTGPRGRRPDHRGAGGRRVGRRPWPGGRCSATTSTPTAPPTCGCPRRSTRSPCG